METLNRHLVSKTSEFYKEILNAESHHNHEIVIVNGVIRWRENPHIRYFDVNETIKLFNLLGYDKNSEVYRKYYRDLGYSLSGYWEVFYWEVNNPNASKYRSNLFNKIIRYVKHRIKL